MRNKRSFSDLCNKKGECAIPCDKQFCIFLTLSEQASGQTRQMDRGEIGVEEERRVRTKCMPVLPTDSEKHESKSVHVASRSLCKTEDSRKHLEIESSLPRVAMDRGFLARSTDADLVTNTILIQKPHNAAEAHQVSHEAPEPHAVNCNLPASFVFLEIPLLPEAFTTNSCCIGSGCLFNLFFSLKKHMVTLGTNWFLVVRQVVTHCTR